MAPVTEDDQARVKALLTEAVTVLCKDGLRHTSQLSIEGLLGITIDRQDILLVNINQTVYADNKKDGRKGKGGKRAAQGAAAQGKKNKPPKPKRRRKGDQQVPPLVLQPNLGQLSIKQEVEQNYPGYNDQLPMGYDEGDFGSPLKKTTPKKKKKRAPPPQVDVMLSEETMVGVQRTIIEQEGCVALSRILQRRKNKFRASVLIHAMREMSRSQSDRHYVGEYKEIGNIKIFYKCPPELLHADALINYSITHQEYTNLFYHDFKPNSGCPTDWGSYVATLMANTPYNPMLFPIDSMGLTTEEKKMLANKQLERQRVFQQSVNNTDSEDHDDIEDHMVMGVGQEQMVEEDLSEEVIDTPGVALSLTIPASGSAEAVVGHLGHVIHVPQTVHGVHIHDTIEDHVGCHETIETDDCEETIETETVIEDSLVMHDEQDYDSPS